MENEQALWSCSIKGMEVCFRDFITNGADDAFFKKKNIILLKLIFMQTIKGKKVSKI